MPGVTYDPAVQFTPHGPVAMHVVIGPRPTGLYALRPVLSNESILGLEKVTAMQKRLSATATMVGVNGDFYADTGRRAAFSCATATSRARRPATAPAQALSRRRARHPPDRVLRDLAGLGQRRTLTT